jgi:hypothetical protein
MMSDMTTTPADAATTGRQERAGKSGNTWLSRFTATALGVLAGIVAAAGTSAVVVAGFTLSFDAISKVAIAAYIRPDWAWLMPVSIDGAMAVATVTAVVMKKLGRSAAYPWLVVLVGAGISVACNATHAYLQGGEVQLPAGAAAAVSAIPAVQLALSVHLLVLLALALAGRFEVAATPAVAHPVAVALPTKPPVVLPAPLPPATAGTLPPDAWVEMPAATDEATHAGNSRGNKTATRTRATVNRGRKRAATRRSGDETRRLAAEVADRFPDATQAEIAKHLDISPRTLRHAMAGASR